MASESECVESNLTLREGGIRERVEGITAIQKLRQMLFKGPPELNSHHTILIHDSVTPWELDIRIDDLY